MMTLAWPKRPCAAIATTSGRHLSQARSLLARDGCRPAIGLTQQPLSVCNANGLTDAAPACSSQRRRVVHGGGRAALATNRPTDAVGNSITVRNTMAPMMPIISTRLWNSGGTTK